MSKNVTRFVVYLVVLLTTFYTLNATEALPPLPTTFHSYYTPGTYIYQVPDGVTSLNIEAWAGGGRGGNRSSNGGAGGGGGGAYSKSTISVTPGQLLYLNVGAGSTSTAAGGDSWISTTSSVSNAILFAKGGNSVGTGATGGAGGQASVGIGTIKYSGGSGASGNSSRSGGGGSSAGFNSNGNNATSQAGASPPLNGGSGGNGSTVNSNGSAGGLPGGGGGGAFRSSSNVVGGAGGGGKVLISYNYDLDAGPDQTQCRNAMFEVSIPTPPSNYSYVWSVVSGSGLIYSPSDLTTFVTVPEGTSTTVRITITDGTTTVTDDVVLTNTSSCSPGCVDPLNVNGDLELEGTANAYNLSFQGTPATLIYQNSNPVGWAERYGAILPNTTNFTGAYYLNKTGVNGDPKSGSKFIYMAGNGFCLSALKSTSGLSCGKTYSVSVWLAAYTNGPVQTNTDLFFEFITHNDNYPPISIAHGVQLPASTSWNNLNWQRYSFEVTIPHNDYVYGDFIFTTLSNTQGVVIDDMCIQEVNSGAEALAGQDQFNCTNNFVMNANTPAVGHTGTWSVVSGSANIVSPNSPNSSVTLSSGNSAQLQWTVQNSSPNYITLIDPKLEGGFELCCDFNDNGWINVSHTVNKWHLNENLKINGRSGAFISSNGGASDWYDLTTSQTSHIYKDVFIPNTASNIKLDFNWKGGGQLNYDRLLVYIAPQTVTPGAGVPASPNTTISGATLLATLNNKIELTHHTINIPDTWAGKNVRIIFTWQNNNSSGTNPAILIDDVSLTAQVAQCSSSDIVNIGYLSGSNVDVNNITLCPGGSGVLTASGCSNGTLLWSTGETTQNILVSPVATTSYSVTCTPASSPNLILNPGFEDTPNLKSWSFPFNASITTTPSDVYAGTKALMLDGGSSYAFINQGFSVTPGQWLKVRFYAKTTNSNSVPKIFHEFYDMGGDRIERDNGIRINSFDYQFYEYDLVVPPNATWFTFTAIIESGGLLFLDNVEVFSFTSCLSSATGTVTVLPNQNITLSNLTIGSCENHPLEDVAPVSVQVAWSSAPAGDYLGVTLNNKTEYIYVGGGATSPQTINFLVPANGATNLSVGASWYFNPNFGCSNTLTFNAPNPCSNDQLSCNILYLCGLEKPADGDAFDHGLIEYIMANNSGNMTPVLVKDNGSAFDLYDPNNENIPLSINLSDYDMILVSPTTENYMSNRLIARIADFKGSILNMNYSIQNGLRMSNGNGYFQFGNTAYTSATNSISVYNYDNINPLYTIVKTGATTKAGAISNLWFGSGDANGNTNAMGYQYNAHSIPELSITHGHRLFLGLHMNGLYANSLNMGALPAPASSYFHPAKHLTIQAKIILDQALKDASKCAPEICENSVDDDGDDLNDCEDPSCWPITNKEFDEGLDGWQLFLNNGSATASLDNTSQLSGYNSARVDINATGGANWHIQAAQLNQSFVAGKTYEVSFMGKSLSNHSIDFAIDLGMSPWTIYLIETVTLNSTAQTFSFTFTPTVTNSGTARVVFNLGRSTGPVWLDKIIFKEVCMSTEICDNGIDDDGDGLIDCADPDCFGACFSEFNFISFGPVNVNDSDIQGRSLFCNNVNLNDYILGSNLPVTDIGVSTYVDGNLTFTNGAVQGGGIMATGSISLTNVHNQGGNPSAPAPVTYPNATNFPVSCPTEKKYYDTLSSTLAALTTNGTFSVVGGDKFFDCNNLSGTVVFNLSLSADPNVFTTGRIFLQNESNASSIIINITHADPRIENLDIQSSFPDYLRKIIWNFPNATRLRMSGIGFKGSVLAPYANLVMENGHIDGNIVVNGMTMNDGTLASPNGLGGQMHTCRNEIECNFPTFYNGNLPVLNFAGCEFHYPNPPIINRPTLCINETYQLYPSSGVHWISSNPSVASVSSSGLITAHAEGNVTFTYSFAVGGCQSSGTSISVIANPTAPIIGAITQPTCTTPTGSVALSGLPSSGSWTITRSPGGTAYNGSGTTFTVSGLPPNTTYTFTVTNSNSCTSIASSNVAINALPTNPTLGGTTAVCVGGTGNVTPSTNGTWTSSNTSIATITNTGVVSGVASGTVTLTYTRTIDGCSNTMTFTVNANPTAPIIGAITQPTCTTPTGSVALSGLPSSGSWTITQSPGGTTYSGSGTTYTVSGLPPNTTYTFTVTNAENCISSSSGSVNVLPIPSPPTVNIDYMGSICLEDNKQISASITGGLPSFGYQWTGPSGFTGNTQVIDITNNGNYYLTVTDANFCTATTSGFVHQRFDPFIVSLQTTVCEGQMVELNVSSSQSIVSYLWSANAGSATTASVNVTPSTPSSIYTVTVTNDIGCTAVPNITINVNPRPTITLVGLDSICVGQTTQFNGSVGGTWTSSNNSIATISSSGLVTGVSQGSVVFYLQNSVTGCISNPSATITIKPVSTVSILGPLNICVNSTTTLSPSSGGSWVSNNPSIASVTNSGVVTGLSAGVANFTFTNNQGCSSSPTANITVSAYDGATISGPDSLCVGTNATYVSSKNGGSWSSSNNSIATINSSGILSALSAGPVMITYTHSSGSCTNQVTKEVIISPIPSINLVGNNTICVGSTTNFEATTTGTWMSLNPAIASINNLGLVTGLSAGTATFRFTDAVTGCMSAISQNITVVEKPSIAFDGPTQICVGGTSDILPNNGGTWYSSNASVASITATGVITGINEGTTRFVFLNNSTGCYSDSSSVFTVFSKPNVTIDYNGSVCLNDSSILSAIVTGGTPDFSYSWTGPSGFTGNTQNVSITNNGNYYLTVTDQNSCSANVSGFVYGRYEPYIVNLNTNICEGEQVTLSVNASQVSSYLWSANAGNATVASVTVTPIAPTSTYYVTVTNTLGCTAVANASITVNTKPELTIQGNDTICINGTSQLTSNQIGQWSAINPSIASINSSGLVTGHAEGQARFIFTNTTTGCVSDTSDYIFVRPFTNIGIIGSNTICVDNTVQLYPSDNGTWTANNPSIATVNSSGLVTGVSGGTASFTFSSAVSCIASGSLNVIVYQKPVIILDGPDQICIGATTNFLPSNGGAWISSNPSIATITNGGVVTGVSSGTARFIYTSNASNCASDSSTVITIISGAQVSIVGSNEICIGGTTQLSPNTGGTWVSSLPSVASITNSGLVTGLSSGTATFTFFDSGNTCPSNPTSPITVHSRPNINFTGPTNVCVGGTSSITSNTSGSWESSNPSIASITAAGVITGHSIGTVTFSFTSSTTGCVSNPSTPFNVSDKPSVAINGTDIICVGSTTQMTPTIGGTWSSTNPSVASISNSGLVTGLSLGKATFVFTLSGSNCISDPSDTITVLPKPIAAVSGQNPICQGQTTTLSPSTGGSWVSLNPSIASVSGNVVTGIANGTARFLFTSQIGCVSDPSNLLVVNGLPNVNFTGPTNLCIGANSTIVPSTGGTWLSSNPSVATITSTGIITAIAPGTATFTFTDLNTGCSSNPSTQLVVNGNPAINLSGPDSICIGQTTNIAPTTGGTWISLNPSIASITNAGIIQGLATGDAGFRFTNTSTGCSSEMTQAVFVKPRPTIALNGSASICQGGNTNLSPSTGGVWISLQPAIASVTNDGVVTGISAGSASFRFTSDATGCSSAGTISVTVNQSPTTSISGSNLICINSTTQFLPNTGGYWTSLDPSIATINNSGLVTGISEGQTTFIFTDQMSNCSSLPTEPINVAAGLVASIEGTADICIGYTTELIPNSGGIWTSSNPQIASVDNGGTVVGKAPGKVTFTYIENGSGCIAVLPNDAISVTNCLDPDFGVTFTNTMLTGDVSTNDDFSTAMYYSWPILVSKPENSVEQLNVNSDGTYSFVADRKGIYHYRIPVCTPPNTFGCPQTQLYITVIDKNNVTSAIVANPEFTAVRMSTLGNPTSVSLNTLENDACMRANGCTLSQTNVALNSNGVMGSGIVGTNGNIIYSPVVGSLGVDYVKYNLCSPIDAHCVEATQKIVIGAPNAVNGTVGVDDFFSSFVHTPISGNVLANDNDAEGDNQSIISQGSPSNPILTPAGSYYLSTDGTFEFTPNINFSGPYEIIYTVCDDNADQFCTNATIKLLIVPDIVIPIRVIVEGAILKFGNQFAADGRPLMRDNLRNSPFTGANYLPGQDPYTKRTRFVNMVSRYQSHGPGVQEANKIIYDSLNVFNTSGSNAIVDWVFVELRSKNNPTVLLGTRSGLLQRDGDVVDLDGVSHLKFQGVFTDSLYVVVRHRSHLGVMSQKVQVNTLIDFTKASTPVFNFGTSLNNGFNYTGLSMKTINALGVRAMWGGDFNGDRKVKFTNPNDDQNLLFFNVLTYPNNSFLSSNYNFAYGYIQGDYDMDSRTKYDNPNDDKNYLFSTVVFYPLNSQLLANFNFLIEQIPLSTSQE